MTYEFKIGTAQTGISDQAYTWTHKSSAAAWPEMKTIRFRARHWWQWPKVLWNRVWHRRLYKFWRNGK